MHIFSLGLFSRLLLVSIFILMTIIWKSLPELNQTHPTLIGYYGEEVYTLHCPSNGIFQMLPKQLGDSVETQEKVAIHQSDEFRLYLSQIERESELAKQQLTSKIALFDLETSLQVINDRSAIQESLAMLWSTRQQRFRVEAHINSLSQSLPKVKQSARLGASSTYDVALLQADLASSKAVVKPLKNQELAQLKSSKLHSSTDSSQLTQMVKIALQSELTSWTKLHDQHTQVLQSLGELYVPIHGVITQRPVSSTQRCSTGDVMVTVQPTTPHLRLWQINHYHQTLDISENIYTYLLSYQGQILSSSIEAKVDYQNIRLELLPPDLQGLAAQTLRLNSLFSQSPMIHGIPVKARLLSKPVTHIPWGHPMVSP